MGPAARRVSHICLCAEFDRKPSTSEIGFHQSIDRTMPLQIRLWDLASVQDQTKEFKGGRLSSSPASDQTVQSVRKFEVCTREETACHSETKD